MSLMAIADCFNHEYQATSSVESAEVLASLARRMAAVIEDSRESGEFLYVASMSGLPVHCGTAGCCGCCESAEDIGCYACGCGS